MTLIIKMREYVLALVLCIGFVSAAEFGINNEGIPQMSRPEVSSTTISNVTANGTINDTEIWITNIGDLDDVSNTQFDNTAGSLNIDLTWLSNYIDSWFSGKTTDDLAEGSINLYDNQSWNEAYADTLYAEIGSESGFGGKYTIYFNTSKKSIILYNLTDSDSSIISTQAIPGTKIIYGETFE